MFVRSKRYPLGKSFPRSTLRAMFAGVYVLYPLGCILQLASTPETFGIAGDIVGLLMIAAALALFAVLAGSSLQRQSQEPETVLDERELAERNRAAFGAHSIFSGLVLLGIIYLMIGRDLIANQKLMVWLPATGEHWNAIFWGLLIASLTLQGALLAWGKGEPEDEAE
jgi:hypothetical protein